MTLSHSTLHPGLAWSVGVAVKGVLRNGVGQSVFYRGPVRSVTKICGSPGPLQICLIGGTQKKLGNACFVL